MGACGYAIKPGSACDMLDSSCIKKHRSAVVLRRTQTKGHPRMKISRKYLKGPHAAAIVVTLFGATALAQTGVPKREPAARAVAPAPVGAESLASKARDYLAEGDLVKALASAQQIGRASWRER